MSDFVWALLFFLWCEAVSLPLRVALAGSGAPGDVRRVLSRVAGAVVLLIPLWFGAHGVSFALSSWFGIAWIAAALWGSIWICRSRLAGKMDVSRLLGYGPGWRREAGLDLLTLGMFMGVVAFRRWVPEMTTYVLDSSAAEKFMNGMIWWSTWHARGLPPNDYWLAGEPLTYYYWGHFFWSWVSRVGGFPATLGLTLAFARMATMGWEACYLLARSFGMRRWGGVLAATAAAWGGNWEGVKGARLGWGGYDFWGPSRAISNNVVDEFPAFSTVLGDFHSHHLALPWVVGWLAMLVGGKRWFGCGWRWGVVWVALGFAAGLSNIWNLPVMGGAIFLSLLIVTYENKKSLSRLGPALAWVGAFVAIVSLGFILMRGGEALPLAESQTAGGWFSRLPLKILPDIPELHSTFPQLWDMWGLGIGAIGIAAVLAGIGRRELPGLLLLAAGCVCMAPIFPNPAFFIWIGVACFGISMAVGKKAWLTKRSATALAGACAVLAGLEVFYIDDAMVGALERYNTYFKLSYPVWPVVMVVAAQGMIAASRRRKREAGRWESRILRSSAWELALIWFGLLSVYVALGIPSRVARARMGDEPARRPTLNAFEFLGHRRGGSGLPFHREAEMLKWIREHVPAGDVVAEGAWVKDGEMFVGGYDFHGRVASLAGRPVPLGWAHHEVQWRGVAGMTLTGERAAALDRLYLAETAAGMREAAAGLGVKWVLYGVLEHERYGRRMGKGGMVLERLSEAGELAAATMGEEIGTGGEGFGAYLFDFRGEGLKNEK